MARIGIFGAGWVGLVTGACFAELGHEVVIRDVVTDKIESLRRGEVPFHEDEVPALLERGNIRGLKGDLTGARQDWERVGQLAPGSQADMAARANLEHLEYKGDTEPAETHSGP